jgi:hypothetical protein
LLSSRCTIAIIVVVIVRSLRRAKGPVRAWNSTADLERSVDSHLRLETARGPRSSSGRQAKTRDEFGDAVDEREAGGLGQ